MIAHFFSWYLAVQLLMVSTLPMTLRLFENLPDRGYAFAKSVGVFAIGVVLWLGYSYGLLRNEAGGVWLAVLIVSVLSATCGWPLFRDYLATAQARHRLRIPWGYVLLVELLFLLTFAGWAYVRAHDPAINHTEQPMDLMFINGIWHSPTYPPRDPWLAGYAISYYYMGYWLLVVLGKMSGLLPEVAYNVGQACWLGLLLLGSFGLATNLLALQGRQLNRSSAAGGVLAAVTVGLMGNLQVVLEWLYANGFNINRLASFFDVKGFPAEAAVTNSWTIGGGGWWWWRSSRVIRDFTLQGNHSEVIDEFPMFSYLLGDNHPHVMAMPFVLLVVALALNMLLQPRTGAIEPEFHTDGSAQNQGWRPDLGLLWNDLCAMMPMGWWGGTALVATSGALIFLNTWDYPAYWLLLSLSSMALFLQPHSDFTGAHLWRALLGALLFGATLLIGAMLFYLPYFLAAQSQADGVAPNLFNPTRLGQFLLMFGGFVPALVGLCLLAWRTRKPSMTALLVSVGATLGAPLFWLLVSVLLALNTARGQEMLNRMPLGPDYPSYGAAVLARWSSQPFTFLFCGLLLGVLVALLWTQFVHFHLLTPSDREEGDRVPSLVTDRSAEGRTDPQRTSLLFVLLLATLGLGLAYAPEFIYLRDHFGTRMNTVFKFYYQAWLLLGLSSVFAIVVILRSPLRKEPSMLTCAAFSLILMASSLLFPVTSVLSKTSNFSATTVTFNGIDYIGRQSPDEMAAIEWVRQNTSPEMIILERMGDSYNASMNRISASTGRATLVGWGGHESQWRGEAYAEMAAGRGDLLTLIYKTGTSEQVAQALREWDIDYVYVGPTERSQYELGSGDERRLLQAMDLAFESGNVRIFARRGGLD